MTRLVITLLAGLGFIWLALTSANATETSDASPGTAMPADVAEPATDGDATAAGAATVNDSEPAISLSAESPAEAAAVQAEVADPAADSDAAAVAADTVNDSEPAMPPPAEVSAEAAPEAVASEATTSEAGEPEAAVSGMTPPEPESTSGTGEASATAPVVQEAALPATTATEPDSIQSKPTAKQAPAGPRHFARDRHDARIMIEAVEESWLRIRDAKGKLVFMRIMKPGDTYRVPNRAGLLLDTGYARGLSLWVDGKPAVRLTGLVRRSIELDPDALARGIVRQAGSAAADASGEEEEKALPVTGPRVAALPTAVSDVTLEIEPAASPDAVNTSDPDEATPRQQVAAVSAVGAAPIQLKPKDTSSAITHATAPVASPASRGPSIAPERPQLQPAAMTAAVTARAAVASPNATGPVTAAAAVTPAGVVGAATSRIGLEVNKGTVVRFRQPAATVFVADPEVADIQVRSPGLVYVFGKRVGETVLYAVDDHDRVLLNTTVVVSHNVSRLRQAIRAVAPDAAVDVTSVDGSLILTGTVASAAEAENIRRVAARFVPDPAGLINQIKVVAPNQINLRVRIAEVTRETLKSFGVSWDVLAQTGSFAFGIATGQFVSSTPLSNVAVASLSRGSLDLNALIDALGTEGLVTVLAEPNLTAMSGETASFLAGGEFPIPVAYPQNNTISIEFKPFGVSLAFTPTLIDGNRINLKVRPEVSQLSSAGAIQLSGFSIPALSTRRAETTVELASGQSFAIAGLLQNNSTQDISKVPFLGDVPILGALFRSDRFRRNESELVIIVTPYIVRPVSGTRLASPTDGLVPPNDVERIIGGKNYRQQLTDRSNAPQLPDGRTLIGPAGFVLE
ncbi:MAG TPA: RodZ domain-containing protein [Alphaproteobacteria bacterium]